MLRALALGIIIGLALGFWAGRGREQRRVRRLIDGRAMKRDGVLHR